MRLHVQSSGQPSNLMRSEVLYLTIAIQTNSVAINGCVCCIQMIFYIPPPSKKNIKTTSKCSMNILLGTGQAPSTTPPEARLCVDLAHIHPKASGCRKSRAIAHTHSSLPAFPLLCPNLQTNHHCANRCESSQRGSSCDWIFLKIDDVHPGESKITLKSADLGSWRV